MSIEIFESSAEVRRMAKVNYLINKEATLITGALYDLEYVETVDDKKEIYLDDVVVKKEELPRLKKSLRKDVYDFFNKKLTTFINRKLKEMIADYVTTKSGKLKQLVIELEDYSNDLDDLINLADEDDRVARVLNRIKVTYKSDLSDTEKLDAVNNYYLHDNVVEEGVTGLIFLEEVAVVMSDKAKIPTNSRLEAGETMLLDKTKPLTKIEDEELPNNIDTLLFKDHDVYIISKSFNNNRTIRKTNLKELWL